MLANSGALRLSSDIATEFGGATPVKMSNYYAGNNSGYVLTGKANGTNVAMVSTGAIKFSEFYGTFKSLVITYSTAGNFTHTVANGSTTLNAYSISGSGGGGGGQLLSGKGGYVWVGGGGGSGGANIMLSKAVVGAQTFSVNVGTGGAAGSQTLGGGTIGGAGTAGASSNLRGGIWGAVVPSSGGGGGGSGASGVNAPGGTAGTGLTPGITGNTGGAGRGGYGISVGATEPTGPFIRVAGSGGSANGTGGGNGGCMSSNTDTPGAGAVGLVVLVFR